MHAHAHKGIYHHAHIFFIFICLHSFFPEGQDWTESTSGLYLSPLLSSPVGRENSRRKILGEKPSLGSSWWDLNLWPLTPQSSALTTRPPNTSPYVGECTCTDVRHLLQVRSRLCKGLWYYAAATAVFFSPACLWLTPCCPEPICIPGRLMEFCSISVLMIRAIVSL